MADQWAKLNDMRLDCELCDVTFSVNGSNFPCHRIVLSCCSNWLRSLLASSEGDGVIILDSLDAGAVEIVVGYLYGEPLSFTPELSEEVIRVIRTFELDEVEIRCWKYLVGAGEAKRNEERRAGGVKRRADAASVGSETRMHLYFWYKTQPPPYRN